MFCGNRLQLGVTYNRTNEHMGGVLVCGFSNSLVHVEIPKVFPKKCSPRLFSGAVLGNITAGFNGNGD